jgi:flagellar motor switch protein FliN
VKTEKDVLSHVRLFATDFIEVIKQRLTTSSERPWSVASVATESDLASGNEIRMKISFEGALLGDVDLRIRREDALVLATTLLGQPTDEYGEVESDSLLNLIASGTTEFCTSAGSKYGTCSGNCVVDRSEDSEMLSDSESAFGFDLSNGTSDPLRMWIRLSAGLAEMLRAQLSEIGGERDESTSGNKNTAAQVNLELVLDVELNVTLRFGRRQLTLREVLELTSGSVIELDRQVEEPVELLLDGKVIARGEAVVIDGNYGLRVTDVPSSDLLGSSLRDAR